jgi:hypothetical protein
VSLLAAVFFLGRKPLSECQNCLKELFRAKAVEDEIVMVAPPICGPNLVADLNEKSSFLPPR